MALIKVNGNLTFDTLNRVLTSDKLPQHKKTLGLAAAFCLECLIAAKGETVSQETLINEGWRKHGFEVSPGNVRQVISQLRRAFGSLKESPDILITVPKMGYRINVTEQPPPTRQPEQGVILLAEAETFPRVPPVEEVTTTYPRYLRRMSAYVIPGCLILCSFLGAALYFFPFSLSPAREAHYQPFVGNTLPDKKIMVDQSIIKNTAYIDNSLKLLVEDPLWKDEASHYSWIYLNGTANKKMHSFFLCDRAVKEKQLHCISRFFIEE